MVLDDRMRKERDLYRALLQLGDDDHLERALADAVARLVDIVDAQHGYLSLHEWTHTWSAGDGDAEDARLFLSQTVVKSTLTAGQAVRTAPRADPRFAKAASVDSMVVDCILCVPIRALGVVYLGRRGVPFSADDETIARDVANAIAPVAWRLVHQDATRPYRSLVGADAIVGRSAALAQVLAQVDGLRTFSPTVLITGPTGAGKTEIARLLHGNSPKASGPFVHVNCGAIPHELFESELFGADAGAYTSRNTSKAGLAEAAARGTLFLDEVGELALDHQAKLLTFLQERKFSRVGSTQSRPFDGRILAATNVDLAEAVRARRFREDLYYRLDAVEIRVPSLAERRVDVPLLAEHLVRAITRRPEYAGMRPLDLHRDAVDWIVSRDWPGNVRELEHVLERALLWAHRNRAKVLGPEAFGEPPRSNAEEKTYHGRVEAFKRRVIEEALEKHQGRVADAADLLGLNRTHLYGLMGQLGIRR